jgi:hypothetical protein
MAHMHTLARWFLFPGEYVVSRTNIEGEDHRETIRMLVNTLVWAFLGILAVVIFT